MRSQTSPAWILGLALLGATGLPGCLDPLVEDTTIPATALDRVLPAGAAVPAAADDPELAARIAAGDGVDSFVPLISAFAAGEPVAYWDFGPSTDALSGVFVLVRRAGDALEMVAEHPTLFGTVPGDPGYSPFWQVSWVVVADSYEGELLTSLDAVQQAKEGGLVAEIVPTSLVVNCPVVAPDVRLDRGPDLPPLAPKEAFYQGRRVAYYDLPPMLELPHGATRLPAAPLLRLRREGGEPLSEPLRGVDMTGDGDLRDSNDLLLPGPAGLENTPLRRPYDLVLRPDAPGIDRPEAAPFDDGAALVEQRPDGSLGARAGSPVLALRPSEHVINAPRFVPPAQEQP